MGRLGCLRIDSGARFEDRRARGDESVESRLIKFDLVGVLSPRSESTDAAMEGGRDGRGCMLGEVDIDGEWKDDGGGWFGRKDKLGGWLYALFSFDR